MSYLWIFLGSYAIAFVLWLLHMSRKLGSATAQLRASGIGEAEIDQLRRRMAPGTALTLIWSTFFTGSLIGAVVSLAYFAFGALT